MSQKQTAEQKVTDAILQETTTVEIGGKIYEVAQPSIATIMKVSSLVSTMPHIDINSQDYIAEMLRCAKDCGVVGEIIATLILGAKRIRDFKRSFLGTGKTELQELSDALLYEKTPKELEELLSNLIANGMDMVFFSRIGISLAGINIVKPTKNSTIVHTP